MAVASPVLIRLQPIIAMLAAPTLTEAEARQLFTAEKWELDESGFQEVVTYAMALVSGDQTETAWAVAAALLALVESQPDLPERWHQAASVYLITSTRLLTQIPDPELFLRAREIADSLVDRARRGGDSEDLGTALVLSAQLWHDPYGLGPNPLAEWLDSDLLGTRRWLRLLRTGGRDYPDDPQMPPVTDSIGQALAQLREATELHSSQSMLLATVVLARVLVSLDTVAPDADLSEVTANVARSALESIRPEIAPDAYLSAVRALQYASSDFNVDAFTLRPVPYASLVNEARMTDFLLTARLAIQIALASSRPELIREVLNEIGPLLPLRCDTERRIGWSASIHALPDDPTRCPRQDRLDISEERNRVLSDAKHNSWTSRQYASALAHLSAHALYSSNHEIGLDLLKESSTVDSTLWSGEALGTLLYISALLESGIGTLREKSSNYVEACGYHAASAAHWAELGVEQLSLEGLAHVDNCIEKGGLQASFRGFPFVSNTALQVSPHSQQEPEFIIQELCRHACIDLRDDLPTTGLLTVLHQVAKGRNFHVAVSEPGPLPADDRERLLLRMIATAEEERARDAVRPSSLQGEIFMASPFFPNELAQASGTIPDQTVRLQKAYELDHQQNLRWRGHPKMNSYIWLEPLQRALPANTVLLSVYLGQGAGGAVVQGVAVTHDSVDISVFPLGEPTWAGGSEFLVHPLSWQCQKLRQALRDDPLFRDVTREAQSWLDTELMRWVGFSEEQLAAWRANGHDHMCIWPHGPLHYAPFHLLSVGGKPLADSWTVSVVPGITMLAQPAPTGQINKRLVVAASSEGGRPFGLPSEDAVIDQAKMIAALFADQPMVNEEATARRFLDQIEGATCVHIAAHGSAFDPAPSFHHLYLGGGKKDDRVFAHDIEHLDLRGVRLVTLSACESSLGRFDLGDNLWGLPGSFLRAGAKAIVGTLWPVGPEVAEDFFGRLYKAIAGDAGMLAAFRSAQQGSRTAYPRYRDWGAFSLLGDWR